MRPGERPTREIARQAGDSTAIADPGEAGRDGNVGRGHGVAAEDAALIDQPIADALGPHCQRIGLDEAAAAETDRQQAVAGLSRDLARRALARTHAMIEEAVDRMKTDARDLPLIAV